MNYSLVFIIEWVLINIFRMELLGGIFVCGGEWLFMNFELYFVFRGKKGLVSE